VVVGIALVILLRALNLLPDGIYDLLLRAAPALLVLFGLSVFLRSRVPLGSFVALIATGALVAGIAYYAYQTRASQPRSDLQQDINQPLPANITLLRVHITTLATDIEISRTPQGSDITGRFVGSSESRVTAELVDAGDTTATFTLREERPSAFPLLESVGRGSLRLTLPAGVALDVDVRAADGNATLSMGGMALERLNVALTRGNATITLPEYDPLGTPLDQSLGTLAALDGNITVVVPASVGGYFELNRQGSGILPEVPPSYNYLQGDILEAREIDDAAMVIRYTITAPRGQIVLRIAE
jgi:hypothetical protein